MKIPSLNEAELAPYLLREELIRQTAEQVKKDFELSGIAINFSGIAGNAYEELFTQMEPHVRRMISSNYRQLLQLLYRIDVSEKRIAEAMEGNENIPAAITRLIIFRELQKVVIRAYYSK